MPLRRGVWQERLLREGPEARGQVFAEAKQACELSTWTDKRALVELYLGTRTDAGERLDVAAALERGGDGDAAALIRKETIRRARTPDELALIRARLLGDETYPRGRFRKEYGAANDDAARLEVVRRFAALAPHDPFLRRRALALFEALGMKVELAEEARRIRQDPFADAALLADVASALARAGAEAEARRAFGELAERAPLDPWARAFLGDRLLAEGRWDEASLAYDVLEDLAPRDPAAAIRAALAHDGAGRVDVAQRLLARVARTGGKRGSRELSELASALSGVLLAEAHERPGATDAEKNLLVRASLELPRSDAETLLLVRVPPASPRVDALLERGPEGARETRKPELSSPALGLYLFRLGAGEGSATLKLARPAELEPARPLPVRISALARGDGAAPPRHAPATASLLPSGEPVSLAWNGEAWREKR